MSENPRPGTRLVLGTRGSELALRQAQLVADRLREAGAGEIELKIITTRGDREKSRPFTEMEGRAFFTRELEYALLTNAIDIAVHSFKDLPTVIPDGLQIAAVPLRANRREMIVARRKAVDHSLRCGLKQSAVVGTSSIRRTAEILHCRPDLHIEPLRGNVTTRIEKLQQGCYDAIIVASAGLERLGLALTNLVEIELHEHVMVPAPAQGALAVQTRSGDEAINAMVRKIDDPGIRQVVEAEREVLRRMGGGCHLPLGVCGESLPGGFRLTAFLGVRVDAGWGRPRRISIIGDSARAAIESTEDFLKRDTRPDPGQRFTRKSVVITRALPPDAHFSRKIIAAGGTVLGYPTLKVLSAGDPRRIREAIGRLGKYSWVLFSSANGVVSFFERVDESGASLPPAVRVAVMGMGTSDAFEKQTGRTPDFIPLASTGEEFAAEFTGRHGRSGMRVLLPTAAERQGALEEGLRRHGIEVDELVVYTTVCPAPEELPEWDGQADAVVFTSGKAAEFFLRLRSVPASAAVVSIGPTATANLMERGVLPIYEPLDHNLDGVLEVLNGVFR